MDGHLRRYLAEEVAVDHAEGLLDRREALRRLALMGFSAVAAAALLVSCAREGEEAPEGAGSPLPGDGRSSQPGSVPGTATVSYP
ncbi:MAG: dienelactone hydrolase family protein, partial [Actinomycetota bacterium]|nr:dienelactone hydrolase family protein [Actinomycetota bacterium]